MALLSSFESEASMLRKSMRWRYNVINDGRYLWIVEKKQDNLTILRIGNREIKRETRKPFSILSQHAEGCAATVKQRNNFENKRELIFTVLYTITAEVYKGY
ncbi:hypothetical protein KQX54_013436 [Cotesia glomerata]|uniref:Uncharacterized protein n=1 Tax=Cotesia glomerata TaxID=32391 RepID=A0AAV7J5S9_COTGL|nr:hypothetical protein KQX54_013436 [Cotesia glomerata]